MIVVGGGLVGAETALTLAISGRNVTLLEMTGQIAQKHESGTREVAYPELAAPKSLLY